MNDLLSVWRSPIDQLALVGAQQMAARQPRCDNTIDQLPPVANPALTDIVPIWHGQNDETMGATLQTIGALIGGGGGGPTNISSTTQFSGLLFNYGYYVGLQSPLTGPVANSNAMTAMINAMTSITNTPPYGGWVWILQNQYSINFVTGGYPVADNTWMVATGKGGKAGGGSGTQQYHFNLTGDGTFFSCAGGHNSGGSVFLGLAIKNANPTLSSTCCVWASQWNIKAEKCNLDGWPVAYVADGISCGLRECTLWWTGNVAGTGYQQINGTSCPNITDAPPVPHLPTYSGQQPVSVILAAPQTYLVGPGEMAQANSIGGSPPGPIGCIGVGLGGQNAFPGGGGNVEHAVIRDYHISDFFIAISYIWNAGAIQTTTASPTVQAEAGNWGTKGTVVDSIEAQCWASAVLMVSPSFDATIFGERFTNCMFQKTSGSTNGSAIFYVDGATFGNGASAINDIGLHGVTIFSEATAPVASTYGLNLFSCSNFKVIGGTISNMGTAINGSANIAITGNTVNNLTFIGVNLRPTYSDAHASNPSQYSVYVPANLSNPVTFDSCNMTGFPASPLGGVQVTGTMAVGSLVIRNCPGYNDQSQALCTPNNPPTVAVSASTASTLPGGVNYYGPSLVIFLTGALTSQFNVNGVNQTVPANNYVTVFLNSPYDQIRFPGANLPTTFNWIGK